MKRAALLVALLQLAVIAWGEHVYKLRKWSIPPGNYSGITHIGGDRYAVVSDKSPGAGFYVWRLGFDERDGRLLNVYAEGFRGVPWDYDRDAEGVAYCPWRQSVFISGEEDQRILEHSLDGTPTGNELSIPKHVSRDRIQPGRGFEALCCDTVRRLLWTVTESSIKSDSTGHLRLLCFGDDLQPKGEFSYVLGESRLGNDDAGHYYGVVALSALGDGSLLVLEREALITGRRLGSKCRCVLLRFVPVDGARTELAEWTTRFTLADTRFANYEGMCLGPVLPDGRQTILLLSDSQAGMGRLFWHLRDRLMVVPVRLD